MVRSTRSQKVERLNAAYTLLAQGVTASEAVLRVVAASGVSLPPECARHGPAGRAGRSADPDHHQDSGHAGGDAAGTFQEQRRFDRGAPVALVHQFQNVVAVDGFERAQAEVVDDDQLHRTESLHHLQIFSGGARLLEVVQPRRQTEIANCAVKQARRMIDRT